MEPTFPWDWYVSPDVLRSEQELIFRGAWHYAGPLEWAPEPGDRFPCLAGDVPIAVVRDGERVLRALVNVCRHRGSVVVSERGRRETLQCPYHAWTYDLDGSLRAAPRSERDASFDGSQLGLRPALVGVVGPFVFVNSSLDAPPLESALGGLPQLLAGGGVDLDELRFRERVAYEAGCNWKIAVENYLECLSRRGQSLHRRGLARRAGADRGGSRLLLRRRGLGGRGARADLARRSGRPRGQDARRVRAARSAERGLRSRQAPPAERDAGRELPAACAGLARLRL